ncbi:hypothetical protein CVT26_015387 [Gymnopilus dilepis]|uniref:Cytochrome P450 n=1 Tax=Gymnopilus dilepis TaxID=231916 RepID=A0A409WD08_9AGAR|nr:hypothetical protein CVT26_015387 [Gymnopilus dilepis]
MGSLVTIAHCFSITMSNLTLAGSLLVVSAALLWILTTRSQNRPPLPPGPPADPIIGHLRMLPVEHSDIFFYELSKTYGKVAHLQIPGRTMIILNSAQAAIDLLDKKSGIYSDRAPSDVFKLMGWEHNSGFLPYGKRFHSHRKMLNEYFSHEKCADYLPFQTLEARRLVQNLFNNPERFNDHLNRFSTAIILRIDYGHEIVSDDDPYLKITADVGYCLTHCVPPGSNLVDLLPIMKYLPSWFPGTFPATQARSYKPIVDLLHDYPMQDVKKQMAEGTAKDSFLLTHIEGRQREGSDYPYSVDDVKGGSGVIFSAGADTTWSSISIFMLAMILYPEAQQQAQKEIDELLGPDRLPEFGDRPNLPYLECVLQETYRWNNAVPTGISLHLYLFQHYELICLQGIPHRSMEDDVYNGMFIPKGSIIVANTRGMTLDEDVYKDPHTFDPSRYLRGEPRPVGQYGFGRRICPGRYLADSSVWIALGSILSAFRLCPITGSDGKSIIPQEDFLSGITNHPKPFECMIIPRNEKARGIVEH